MRKTWLVAVSWGLSSLSFGQAAAPTVDELLDKALAAVGGRAALSKVTSVVAKGSFELPDMGVGGTLTTYAKGPNKSATVIMVEGYGEIRQGCDGETAWSVTPQGETMFDGARLEEAKRDAAFMPELKLKELYPKIEIKGKEKVGEREAWVAVLTPAKGNTVTTYYDAETWLPLKSGGVRNTDQGEAEVWSEPSDWREAPGGIKLPHVMKQKLPIGTLIVKIGEVQTNVEIEDAKFKKAN